MRYPRVPAVFKFLFLSWFFFSALFPVLCLPECLLFSPRSSLVGLFSMGNLSLRIGCDEAMLWCFPTGNLVDSWGFSFVCLFVILKVHVNVPASFSRGGRCEVC